MAAAPLPLGKQADKSAENGAGHDRFRRQFHKTRLCIFHMKGQCKYGTSCAFAHNEVAVCEMPDLTKTSLCSKFMKGKCPLTAAECGFAHGKRELKMTAEYAKCTQDKAAAKSAKDLSAPNTKKGNHVERKAEPQIATDMVHISPDGLDIVDPSMQMSQGRLDFDSVQMFQNRLDLATLLGLKMPMSQGVVFSDASSTASTTLHAGDASTRSTSSNEEDALLASHAANVTLTNQAYRANYERDLAKQRMFPPPGLDGFLSCEPMKVTLSSSIAKPRFHTI